jgi:hypothetical protein
VFGGQQMNPRVDRQGTWLSGQAQITPPVDVMTQCDPWAQQIAGPPATAWQTWPFLQQMLPAVNTVPFGQTHVPLDATVPSGQQNWIGAPVAPKVLTTWSVGQQTWRLVFASRIQVDPAGQHTGAPVLDVPHGGEPSGQTQVVGVGDPDATRPSGQQSGALGGGEA